MESNANQPQHDKSLDSVRMIFRRETGETVLWNPGDCLESGTPIDEETGDDLEYVGLCRVDANENPTP